MMKMFITTLLLLFVVCSSWAQGLNPNNTITIGKKSSSADKGIVFETNDGAANKSIKIETISKLLKFDGDDFQIGDGGPDAKSYIFNNSAGTKPSLSVDYNSDVLIYNKNNMRMGDGTVSDMEFLFNQGSGSSAPGFKFDSSTGDLLLRSRAGEGFAAFGTGGSGGSGGINFLANPSFESNLNDWSNTGGTFTQETHTNGREGNGKYARFVATASGQYFESDLITISDDVNGGCMADFKYNQGDAAFDYQVLDASSTVINEGSVSDSTEFLTAPIITFPCSGGDQFRLRVISTMAGTIDADESYLGSNLGLSNTSQATILGTLSYAAATNCAWFTSSTTITTFSADTDCSTPTTTGQAQAPSTKIPAIKFTSLKPGKYEIDILAKLALNTSGVAGYSYFAVYDGNTYSDINMGASAYFGGDNSLSTNNSVKGVFTYTENQGETTFELAGFASNASNGVLVQADPNDMLIVVKYFPLESTPAYTPEQADFFVSANIGGAQVSLSATSTPLPATNAGLDMVLNSGSAKIPCSGTNPATGLTCSAGNEAVGIQFNAPRSGKYKVCFNGSVSSSGTVSLRLVETENESETILQTGDSGLNMANGHSTTRICDIFSFNSVGTKTIRVFYEASSSGLIQIDRVSSTYDRDTNFTVEMVGHNVSRPIVQNMVDTSVGSGTKTNSCCFNYTTSSPSIKTESGLCESWIDSVSEVGIGNPFVTLTTGTYSKTPICSVESDRSAGNPGTSGLDLSLSTNSLLYFWIDDASSTNTRYNFCIKCEGAR